MWMVLAWHTLMLFEPVQGTEVHMGHGLLLSPEVGMSGAADIRRETAIQPLDDVVSMCPVSGDGCMKTQSALS
jgi:hypothetical protein